MQAMEINYWALEEAWQLLMNSRIQYEENWQMARRQWRNLFYLISDRNYYKRMNGDEGSDGGGSSSGRTGTQESGNGVSLAKQIKKEFGCEINKMKEFTDETGKETGCLITRDKYGNICFVDYRIASEEGNHISWWKPQIPEGHTYLGTFHTHPGNAYGTIDIFSQGDFGAYRSVVQDLLLYNQSIGEFTVDIMVSTRDDTFNYVITNNYNGFIKWATDNCSYNSEDWSTTRMRNELNNVDWGSYHNESYNIQCVQYRNLPKWISRPK